MTRAMSLLLSRQLIKVGLMSERAAGMHSMPPQRVQLAASRKVQAADLELTLCWHLQVHSMVTKLAQYTDIRAALIVGGLSLSVQSATLRTSPEILVATPASPCSAQAFLWPL